METSSNIDAANGEAYIGCLAGRDLIQQLDDDAAREELSRSDIIRRILREHYQLRDTK